jgi:hypothetical protein
MLLTSVNVSTRASPRTSNKNKDKPPLLPLLLPPPQLPQFPPQIQALKVVMSPSTSSNKLPRLLKLVVPVVVPL